MKSGKQPGTIDVALSDGAGNEEYLAANLFAALDVLRPDVVFYQAGVDPYLRDRLGRLALTLGGGYARDVTDTVEAHCNTPREARAVFSV